MTVAGSQSPVEVRSRRKPHGCSSGRVDLDGRIGWRNQSDFAAESPYRSGLDQFAP